jgi:hypothetical protein
MVVENTAHRNSCHISSFIAIGIARPHRSYPRGRSRYNHDWGTAADTIVGEERVPQYAVRANNGGIERVLV